MMMPAPRKADPFYDFDEICERLGNGETLIAMAKERGVSTVSLWQFMNRPEHKEQYKEALAARGMLHALQTEQYVQDMLEKRIDPKTADVAIKSSQWMASKLTPELFGDRRATEITVNDEQSKHLAALKEKAQKRIEEQKKLEGENKEEEVPNTNARRRKK